MPNLTEIIPRQATIHEGHSSAFIASKNFQYNELPILKDSFVYYDGENHLSVNLIFFGIFQKSNVPNLIPRELPMDQYEDHVIIDSVGDCHNEITELDLGYAGIWHKDHFDKWEGKFSSYIQRIQGLDSLNYNGISFSPLMYAFNIEENTLEHFINTTSITLNLNNTSIELPELLEISCENNYYSIIPLSIMEYNGLKLSGVIQLTQDGVISGNIAEEFEAQVEYGNENKTITISKGKSVSIYSNGDVETRLPNPFNQNEIVTYFIRPLN